MKRDLDLIRLILIAIESQDEAIPSMDIRVQEYGSKDVSYNLNQLKLAGFLDVPAVHHGLDGSSPFIIKGLTHAGHDYLAAVHKPKVWERVKDRADRAGISLTMDIARALAIKVAREAVGLTESA